MTQLHFSFAHLHLLMVHWCVCLKCKVPICNDSQTCVSSIDISGDISVIFPASNVLAYSKILVYSEILFGKCALIFLSDMISHYKTEHSCHNAHISFIYGESFSIFPVNDSTFHELGVTTYCLSDLLNGIWQQPLLCNIFGQSGLVDDRKSGM